MNSFNPNFVFAFVVFVSWSLVVLAFISDLIMTHKEHNLHQQRQISQAIDKKSLTSENVENK